VTEGILPCYRLGKNGRSIMFREDRLVEWLKAHEQTGALAISQ